MDQAALVVRAQRGDAEAFDTLVRLTGDTCMAIAVRILRDAGLAEDAVQTAYITAWRELRTLRDPARFEPWLHRILTHECYAEARRRTRRSDVVHILPRPDEESGATLTIHDRDQLERAFRRLTLEQRAVVVFSHFLDLSTAEVADRLGVPPGTVKSRLHHAMQALRASVEADARTTSRSQERRA